VSGLDPLARDLHSAGAQLVSPGVVAVADGLAALLVRDPDGHAVELHEPGRPARSAH
jgi:hypothetical protein